MYQTLWKTRAQVDTSASTPTKERSCRVEWVVGQLNCTLQYAAPAAQSLPTLQSASEPWGRSLGATIVTVRWAVVCGSKNPAAGLT